MSDSDVAELISRFTLPPKGKSSTSNANADDNQGEDIDYNEEDLSGSDDEMQSDLEDMAGNPQPTPTPDDHKRGHRNHESTPGESRPKATAQLPPKDGIDPKAAIRAINLFTAKDNDSDLGYTSRAYKQATTAMYRYLCDILEIDHTMVAGNQKTAKKPMFDLLVQSLKMKKNRELLRSYLPAPSYHDGPIFGKDVMAAVWADMERTQLPSWIRPAPRDWGTSKRGKLSADQWRVLCTIHLVITLIHLWEDETGRKKDLLENFMHLVTAVRIANMRATSPNQIRAYNQLIFRYAEGIKHLFPYNKLRPVVHTALHIGDGLELFGPSHAHSAPFYERYINFLHRIKTNGKIGLWFAKLTLTSIDAFDQGELESTLLKTSSRSANLRAVLADDEDVRETVLDMVTTMESIDKEEVRGFRLANQLDPGAPQFMVDAKPRLSVLDARAYEKLCELITQQILPQQTVSLPNEAHFVEEIALRGVGYATSRSSKFRSSRIVFQLPGDLSQRAEVVRDIIHYRYRCDKEEKQAFYIAVSEFVRRDLNHDPYPKFGFAGGFLCDAQQTSFHLLELSQVVSHFGLTRMKGKYNGCIHVMPLDRLMLSFKVNEEEPWGIDDDE